MNASIPVRVEQHYIEYVCHDRRCKILKREHRHIRSQSDPRRFGIYPLHGAHPPHRIFKVFHIEVVQTPGNIDGGGHSPNRIRIEPDTMLRERLAQRDEGIDFFIRRKNAVLVL